MEEERPEVEAEDVTPQTEEPTEDTGSGSGSSKGLLIGGGIVVALLIIAGLFLPPISLGERLSGGNDNSETADSTTADPTEETANGADNAEIAGEVAITSASPVNVASIAGSELAAAGIAELPQNVALQSNVYTVDTNGTAVSGQAAINVPAGADASMSDVYGWNGAAWEFVPSTFDAATQQRITPDHSLYQAFALGATQAPANFATGGELRQLQTIPDEVVPHLSEVTAGTLTLVGTGDLQGEITTLQEGAYDQYIWVTNVGAVTDQASLSAFLNDTTAQMNQVNALVNTAVSGNYAGINLDYQGVDVSQRDAFSSYVQSLANALDAQGKNLIVTLATPQNVNDTWDAAGQDWAAIGAAADTVYVLLPLDPTQYGEGGNADKLVQWATDHIDRSKIVALTHASAVDRLGESFIDMSNEQALTNFGQMEFTAGGPEVEPGTAIELALSGSAGPLEWDSASSTYRYTYEDTNGQTHTVWLGNPASTTQRLNTAVKHNLKGAAVRGLGQINDPAGFVAALNSLKGQGPAPEPTGATIVWKVTDEAESILASNSEGNMTFAWEGSADPGNFAVNVDFAFGDALTSLGASPVVVATAEAVEEVVEETTEETTEETEETVTVSTADLGDTEAIVNNNVNVRVGPGLTYGIIAGGLNKGATVEVIGRSEDSNWLNVIMPDGAQKGWIFATLLDLSPSLNVAALEIGEVAAVPVADGGDGETTAPAAPPPPVNVPTANVGNFELGGQTHTLANPQLMQYAGMNWVKFQHKWGVGDNPGDLAGRINNAHGNGMKVLLAIPGADHSNINYQAYADFVGGVAALGPDAIEIWNEMNIDREWPSGQIDPAVYTTQMLAPAYNAIKAANPNVMVISGAPAPTGFFGGCSGNGCNDDLYMAGMAAAGAANYMDCIGIHYNEGILSPNQTSGDPRSEHYTRYFWGMVNTYYNAFGGSRPLCFTELGYLSGQGYPPLPGGFSWAGNTTIAQHATWLAEAASLSANSGKVRMLIVFNVDFTHYTQDDPQAGYGMIRKDGSCPACETLHQVMGGG